MQNQYQSQIENCKFELIHDIHICVIVIFKQNRRWRFVPCESVPDVCEMWSEDIRTLTGALPLPEPL